MAKDFKSVHTRQHDIEDNEYVIILPGALQAAFTVINSFDEKAFRLQVLAYESAEFNVVVNNQNSIHLYNSLFTLIRCLFHVKNCQTWTSGVDLTLLGLTIFLPLFPG